MPYPRALNLIELFQRGSSPTWGYVFYRTTYTPQSYRQFPAIIKLIDSSLKKEIQMEYHREKDSWHGYREELQRKFTSIAERHQSILLEDPKRLNGLPIPDVRKHFEDWVENGEKTKGETWYHPSQTRLCFVIDEEVCSAMEKANAFKEAKLERQNWDHGRHFWIKAVEAWPDYNEWTDTPGIPGTMKVSIFDLWWLWLEISDPYPMWMMERDEDGMYTC